MNWPEWMNYAWLAGFIDGEGCLSISKEYDKRKGDEYFHYRASLQVTNTYPASIDAIKWIVDGGEVKKVEDGDENHQPLYRYQLRNQEKLLDLLLKISPYLRVKQIQSSLIVKFLCNRKDSRVRGWYAPHNDLDHEIYIEMKNLNARGKYANDLRRK